MPILLNATSSNNSFAGFTIPKTQPKARGCTTNPPLSWEAVRGDIPTWSAYVDQLIEENPDLDNQKIAWLTYKEVIRQMVQR